MALRRVGLLASLALLDCRPGADSSRTEPPAASPPAVLSTPTTDVEELRAFAKLYGYVRFFDPSDTAAAADWDLLAVEGARRVVQGTTRQDLLVALNELFGEVAPTVMIHPVEEPLPTAAPPKDGEVIAWQHLGFGFGELVSAYYSGRTNRPRRSFMPGSGFAHVSRSIPAADVRGKRVRLRGWARVDGRARDGKAQLWLRIDGAGRGSEFLDNMQDRPLASPTWTEVVLESPVVGPRATKVVFGGFAIGSSTVDFDDLVLESAPADASTWTPVALDNLGFESGMSGWTTESPGYAFATVADAHGGKQALRITRRTTVSSTDLFAEHPRLGEVFEAPLAAGLACRVTLAIPKLPYDEREPPAAPPLPDAGDPAVRAAAVVVAWNVLRHFYPYHDVIGEDWEAVLDLAITDVLDDRGPEDLQRTLQRLVHRLHDGHGHVDGPIAQEQVVPLRLAHVENVHVVLAAPKDSGVRRGDELVAIDGVPVAERYAERAALASGSPQWIDFQLLAGAQITSGPKGSRARLELRRDGVPLSVELERAGGMPPLEHERKVVEKLPGGVLYVDLVRIDDAELTKRLPELARARAVVFDVRGYPTSQPGWLSNLLTKPDTAKWMFIPHVIRPDYAGVDEFTALGWDMQPAQPHIGGKLAFLTGPGAISYAESVMGYIEGYQLGAIVGSATAGANGNVNPFTLPGGFRITFTGLKVTRMDGRQHHVVGIQPTHPVTRTLAGIRAGRDEELEAALALVRPTTRK